MDNHMFLDQSMYKDFRIDDEQSFFLDQSITDYTEKQSYSQDQQDNYGYVKSYNSSKRRENNFNYPNSQSIKQIPMYYTLFSLLSLIIVYMQSIHKYQQFDIPHFLELPFFKPRLFQISIAIVVGLGIVMQYLIYKCNPYTMMVANQQYRFQSFNMYNSKGHLLAFILGVLQQITLFVFAILPEEEFKKLKIIKVEDTFLLNIYFGICFLSITCNLFVFRKTGVENKIIKSEQNNKFVEQCEKKTFIYVLYIFLQMIYLVILGIGIFELGETFSFLRTKDNWKEMVVQMYSVICYLLFIFNSIYALTFKYELQNYKLQLIPLQQDAKNRNMINQNTL